MARHHSHLRLICRRGPPQAEAHPAVISAATTGCAQPENPRTRAEIIPQRVEGQRVGHRIFEEPDQFRERIVFQLHAGRLPEHAALKTGPASGNS